MVKKNQRYVVVLGGGESGVGAALLAQQKGFKVFLSDGGKLKSKYKEVLTKAEIEFEEGKHSQEEVVSSDLVIKSPGIPENVPLVKLLIEKGIPVISEIEFAARYTKGKLIGITGSNGKTTTTIILYNMLKKAKLDVACGGNIGKSFAWQLVEKDYEYWVLELSSFQLDGMFETKLDIAILTNIVADHLDRYEYKLENYIASKMQIVQNQTAEDHFIYWVDDEAIVKAIKEVKPQAQLHPFSLKSKQLSGAWLDEQVNELEINIKGTLRMSIQELAMQGKHNANNTMAASIASRILEIRKEVVRESLSDFQNIEHRLEFVTKVSGVEYINDSKATNVNSTWYALESMEKPTVWIVGGMDKGNDYSELFELVQDKVTCIIALGKDNSKIVREFEGKVEMIYDLDDMREAVGLAYRIARKGDAVLLSPCCASFDLFESFEERGRLFKEAVRSL